MRKIIYYKNGQVVVQDGVSMRIGGVEVERELDLTGASDEDFKAIAADPHNKSLIDKAKGSR